MCVCKYNYRGWAFLTCHFDPQVSWGYQGFTIVRVIYFHSKINVVQSNRLYNLKSFGLCHSSGSQPLGTTSHGPVYSVCIPWLAACVYRDLQQCLSDILSCFYTPPSSFGHCPKHIHSLSPGQGIYKISKPRCHKSFFKKKDWVKVYRRT
jgi:hypothetical protein